MLCLAAFLSGCAKTTAPAVPQASDAATPVEEIEILKITVGTATQLTTNSYQNTSALSVSRTGAVAAHYPKPPREVKKYRISNDAGKTLGGALDAPTNWSGAMSVGRRAGGALDHGLIGELCGARDRVARR